MGEDMRIPVWEIVDSALNSLITHYKNREETTKTILEALYMVTPEEKEIIKRNDFSLGNIRFERFYSKRKNK